MNTQDALRTAARRVQTAGVATGQFIRRHPKRWGALLAIALLLVGLRLWPKPSLSAAVPSSRSVVAAGGELLRLTLAADEQYRLWTPLTDIAPPLQDAVRIYEDRWFRWHYGVNPWALARAAGATALGKRRIGGSTITMQLARRLYGIDSRRVGGKLQQALAAIWLELRYGKDEILEAYLNLAPFGGNVEGVGAASLVYFHKPVRLLNVPEAANLAVIPQNPRKRLAESGKPGEAPDELRRARARLLARWAAVEPDKARFRDEATLRALFHPRSALPFRAPHLVDHLLRSESGRVVGATIDLTTQAVVERVLGEYVKSRGDAGIVNASALLLDASTMQVKALVGSADYRNEAIAGQVNGAFGKRSPGSTLKPFIYALALDQGLIHSASILKDAPSAYGAFSPENFDGRFAGPLPAQEALIRSRNVPAVDLAARLGKPGLYEFLKMAGVRKLAPEAHYGLALVLGGGEVTMEELAQLYAVLANRGKWQELRYSRATPPPARTPALLSEAAAFITLDMLRHSPRPDTYAPAKPAVAWKTGTSWGFRDAWTAGVFGRHVLVVWVGNFDGSSNPALIGIEAAAPLFLRIVDALRAERLDPGEMAITQPTDLQRVEVCTASGDLPNDACPQKSQAWFIAGKSPIRRSTLHQTVLIDTRTGRRVCQEGPHTRREVFETWGSDMLAIFRQAGLPLRTPPAGSCGEAEAAGGPRIVAPLRGVIHVKRVGRPEPLYLRGEAAGDKGVLHWFVDDALVGRSKPGEALPWLPPEARRYTLRVVDAEGRADTRDLQIELAE